MKERHCHRARQSRKGCQVSANRVGEFALRYLTDSVLAICQSLRPLIALTGWRHHFHPLPLQADGQFLSLLTHKVSPFVNMLFCARLITVTHTYSPTALSVRQTEIPLVVECIDHKRNLPFPKACQGDSIKLWQHVCGKTTRFATYVPPFSFDGDSSF